MTARQATLETLRAALAVLSPQATLSRGYAIVRGTDGRLVRDAAALKKDDALTLRFARGGAEAVVIKPVPD